MIKDEVLKAASEHLAKLFHPQKIILFGSHARSTADSHSDVDLLVVMPVQGSRRDMAVEMYQTLRGFDFACDIVIITPEEFEVDRHVPGTIARPASREGRILYAAA